MPKIIVFVSPAFIRTANDMNLDWVRFRFVVLFFLVTAFTNFMGDIDNLVFIILIKCCLTKFMKLNKNIRLLRCK